MGLFFCGTPSLINRYLGECKMNPKPVFLIVSISAILLFPVRAFAACDLCAIYSSLDPQTPQANSLTLSIAEQFTTFDKIQQGGEFVHNSEHQRMESSITQFVAEYDLSEKFAFQVTLPYINRSFSRVENGEREKGSEAGVGDLSLLARISPANYRSAEVSVFWDFFAGIKLPTGDSDRLAEELEHHSEEEEGGHDEEHHHQDKHSLRHGGESHGTVSAVHGHDLALGSGSYDFPFGGRVLVVAGKWLADADLSYTFRTGGDFGYCYDNHFIWGAGAGYYVLSGHSSTVVAKLSLSGERKGKDEAFGVKQDDTGVHSVFWGPAVAVTFGESLSSEFGADFPIDVNNNGLQAVPSYRLKAAVSYRF